MNKALLSVAVAVAMFSTQAVAQDASSKTNAYIDCYNGVSGRAIDSINRYNSWVKDMKKGPTGKERVVYGLYGLHEHAVKNCQKNVPAAIAAEPKLESLDKAADAYLKAVVALNEKVVEADRYYSRENYKDDKFEKGKAMHKPLADAMDAFVVANDALGSALDEQSSNAMKQQLAEIEKTSGKEFQYWLLSTMIDAKAAVDLLTQEKFDVEKAKTIIAAYENSADNLIEKVKAGDSMEMMKYSMLEMELDEYRKAIKQRMRRVRDNTPYSTGEKMNLKPGSGWMVDGSTYKVSRNYNRLIEAVNR